MVRFDSSKPCTIFCDWCDMLICTLLFMKVEDFFLLDRILSWYSTFLSPPRMFFSDLPLFLACLVFSNFFLFYIHVSSSLIFILCVVLGVSRSLNISTSSFIFSINSVNVLSSNLSPTSTLFGKHNFSLFVSS